MSKLNVAALNQIWHEAAKELVHAQMRIDNMWSAQRKGTK